MRLSRIFGVSPEHAAQLEDANVRTLRDLANATDLAQLSARSHAPLDLLERWHALAQAKVAARRRRHRAAAVFAAVTAVLLSAIAVWSHKKGLSPRLDEAVAHYNRGNTLSEKREYDAAIAEYRKALTLNPDSAETHNNLGVALYQTAGCEAAIPEYQRAIDLDASYAQGYNNLASCLVAKGRYEEAETAYKQAIVAWPNDTLTYYNLWLLYRNLERNQQTQEVFRTAQRIDSKDKYVQLMVAEDKLAKEDFAGAIEILSSLSTSDNQDSYVVSSLATAEIIEGMKNDRQLISKGVARLKREVERNPSYSTCFALAWAYSVVSEIRNYDEAERLYRTALTFDPYDPATLSNLVVLAAVRGDAQGVIEFSHWALLVDDRNPQTRENLGFGLFLKGDLQGALANLRIALEILPHDPGLLDLYGETYLWLGDTTKAHEQFEIARNFLTQSPELSNDIWVRLISARYDPAEPQRAVLYYSASQKQASLELLDGLAYLRENRVALALERYHAATGMLAASREDDNEVVRQGINNLHRLEGERLEQPMAALGLVYLYQCLGEGRRAAHYWQLYQRSGTDTIGIEEARRQVACKYRTLE